jgi:hypothetical protein
MGLPSYQISVISNTTGAVVKVLDMLSIYELQYSRKLNDVGTFVAVLPSTAEFYALFDWDTLIDLYRTSPVTGLLIREETYLVRSKHRFREGNEERLVIGGMSLNHLLMRRVINPADDPASVDGYSVKSGPGDVVIASYVSQQAGPSASAPRQTPGLAIIPADGAGSAVNITARYNNLFNKVQDIAFQSGVDFIIERTSGLNLAFKTAIFGNDYTKSSNYPFTPWVGINPARGNMQSPSLNIDRGNENNYVYALGQGQGEQRRVYEAASSGAVLSPYNRCEFAKDARNVEQTNTDGLASAAFQALQDERVPVEFSFTPTGIEPGAIYRQNWDIGDRITAIWEDFIRDLRMISVEIHLQGGDEEISVTVGDQYSEESS